MFQESHLKRITWHWNKQRLFFAPCWHLIQTVCAGKNLKRAYGGWCTREGQRQMHDLKPAMEEGMFTRGMFNLGLLKYSFKYIQMCHALGNLLAIVGMMEISKWLLI